MANVYRKINTDLVAATVNTAYTVPDNSRALVKSIHVYNNGAGAADITVTVGDYASSTDFIYDNSASLAQKGKEEFVTNVLILEEQDTLKLLSDITGPDVTISLLEINREDK
tara:strand:- start:1045 stop:1380 length:336 start_codon:yes stop_codon:yes gene_type:complete